MHVISVVGKHNIGKTQVLEAIITNIVKKYKIAVIKHTVHEIKPDEEGTDTQRLKKVGAYPTFIMSDYQSNPNDQKKVHSLESLITTIKNTHPNIDILFLEGYKRKNYPKIVVIEDLDYLNQFKKEEILFSLTKNKNLFCENVLDFNNIDNILSKLENYLEK